MNLGQQFLSQWQSQISLQVSCFDRLILTGYLPFWSADTVNKWIGGRLGIRHIDFLPQMKRLSDPLRDSAKRQTTQAATPLYHLQWACRKQAPLRPSSLKHR